MWIIIDYFDSVFMDDQYFRCDTKNIGLTMLCKFDGDVPLPAIWSHQVIIISTFALPRGFARHIKSKILLQVLEEYKKMYPEEELPDFLKCDSSSTISLLLSSSQWSRSDNHSHIFNMQFKTINLPFKCVTFRSDVHDESFQGPCQRQFYTQLPTLTKEGSLI